VRLAIEHDEANAHCYAIAIATAEQKIDKRAIHGMCLIPERKGKRCGPEATPTLY